MLGQEAEQKAIDVLVRAGFRRVAHDASIPWGQLGSFRQNARTYRSLISVA